MTQDHNVSAPAAPTGSTHEQRVAAGRVLFDQLSASDSGIRGFSEALRTNSSDTYNRDATANAFESGVSEDVQRLGQIAERFSRVRESD